MLFVVIEFLDVPPLALPPDQSLFPATYCSSKCRAVVGRSSGSFAPIHVHEIYHAAIALTRALKFEPSAAISLAFAIL